MDVLYKQYVNNMNDLGDLQMTQFVNKNILYTVFSSSISPPFDLLNLFWHFYVYLYNWTSISQILIPPVVSNTKNTSSDFFSIVNVQFDKIVAKYNVNKSRLVFS